MNILRRVLISIAIWTSVTIPGAKMVCSQAVQLESYEHTIVLHDQKILLLSKPLSAFPLSLAELEHILGTPERTMQLHSGRAYFWDSVGIAGHALENADGIQQLDIFYREPFLSLVYPEGAIQSVYSGAIIAGTDGAITKETDYAFAKKHGYDIQPETGVIHKKVGVFAIFLEFTKDELIA